MRLLLVDDNRMNLEYFVDALEGDGHVVETETDGERARDRALRERFDLLLLDIQLPGMNGDAICQELRAAGVDVPIIALTSAAMPEQVARGVAAGFTSYLTKPIPPAILREAVRRHARADR